MVSLVAGSRGIRSSGRWVDRNGPVVGSGPWAVVSEVGGLFGGACGPGPGGVLVVLWLAGGGAQVGQGHRLGREVLRCGGGLGFGGGGAGRISDVRFLWVGLGASAAGGEEEGQCEGHQGCYCQVLQFSHGVWVSLLSFLTLWIDRFSVGPGLRATRGAGVKYMVFQSARNRDDICSLRAA